MISKCCPPPTLADDLVRLLATVINYLDRQTLSMAAPIPTYRSSLSPPFCPLGTVVLFVLGGSIRRITLEKAERPN